VGEEKGKRKERQKDMEGRNMKRKKIEDKVRKEKNNREAYE
jgi:hypothetical protein